MYEKTIDDCRKFVEEYNKAFENGDIRFFFEMNNEMEKRSFTIQDFKIELNDEIKVKTLLKAENRYIDLEGSPYCPCKIDHTPNNICPCEECLDEIKEKGVCCCKMYIKGSD